MPTIRNRAYQASLETTGEITFHTGSGRRVKSLPVCLNYKRHARTCRIPFPLFIFSLSRLRTKFTDRIASTSSFSWLNVLNSMRTIPRPDSDRDALVSMTSASTRKVSPGRTGLIQRIDSMPGEPIPVVPITPVSINRRNEVPIV